VAVVAVLEVLAFVAAGLIFVAGQTARIRQRKPESAYYLLVILVETGVVGPVLAI
jgi:hypothetical protein